MINEVTLDLSPYRVRVKEDVKIWLDNKGINNLEQTISELAIYTAAPVIAIVTFIIEILGSTEELEASLKRKLKYYNYSNTIG